MHGYSLERKDRNNGRGGGVACYVRNGGYLDEDHAQKVT